MSVTTEASGSSQSASEGPSSRGMPSADAKRSQELSRTLKEVLDRICVNGRAQNNDGNTHKKLGNLVRVDEQQSQGRSLEDRFEFVRLCLAAAGFPSIDAMVGEYYTADFCHDSPIARHQRISRHSQLPALVAQLRGSAGTWSHWESHGYQSEIMNSATSLLQNEQSGFVASRSLLADARSELERLRPRAGATDGQRGRRRNSSSSSSGAFQLLTKTLQDKVRFSVLCSTSPGMSAIMATNRTL